MLKSIDYKDVETLKKFLNPHGRVIARRYTGVTAKQQRKIAREIKKARFMALLPYLSKQ
jgi:small subunit ribosomal protein S18